MKMEVSQVTNVMEFEAIAKKKLPKMIYDYYASGAEDEWTLKENRSAFSRIVFRPRILIDVTNIDISTTILGFNVSMPIMIAPTGMQKMAHPEGELAIARAAFFACTIMTLSSLSNSSIEDVASTGPGLRFFQLYANNGEPSEILKFQRLACADLSERLKKKKMKALIPQICMKLSNNWFVS